MYLVQLTADGKIHCDGCGRTVEGVREAQDPAPCGCAWVWTDNGRLEAVPSRHDWWRCECGRTLPEAIHGKGTTVLCDCGRLWRFDHWALRRWPGDTGVTPLEPRLIAWGEGDEPSAT